MSVTVVLIGASLAVLSLVLRLMGLRASIELCGKHWDELFGSRGDEPFSRGSSAGLFPDGSPADFDEMICRAPGVLRNLPPAIAKAGFRRIALRNWARAALWGGLLLIVVGLLPIF